MPIVARNDRIENGNPLVFAEKFFERAVRVGAKQFCFDFNNPKRSLFVVGPVQFVNAGELIKAFDRASDRNTDRVAPIIDIVRIRDSDPPQRKLDLFSRGAVVRHKGDRVDISVQHNPNRVSRRRCV